MLLFITIVEMAPEMIGWVIVTAVTLLTTIILISSIMEKQ